MKYMVIAPPPTPNGDLHLGHLAGPYLGADIFKRLLAQRDKVTYYSVSTDDNQSYVDTTALSLSKSPEELIESSRREITETLAQYTIDIDNFGEQDENYAPFIKEFFSTISQDSSLYIKEVPVVYDLQGDSYPVESWLSGICSYCLSSTCGGICETCGHPNSGVELLGLDSSRYEIRHKERLIIDLSMLYDGIWECIGSLELSFRPALKQLICSLKKEELGYYILSYELDRGIELDFLGLESQKLNVWAEMYPGHFFFLQRALPQQASLEDAYVQFLGFDNSYFYTIIHVALNVLAKRYGYTWPSPSAFVTNQFYNLSGEKFSTSKNHLIWAKELSSKYNSDLIRLYLALNGPEFQEANFIEESFKESARTLEVELNNLVSLFNSCRQDIVKDNNFSFPKEINSFLSKDISFDTYSHTEFARSSLLLISYLYNLLNKKELSIAPYIPALIVFSLEPFCPKYCQKIKIRFNYEKVTWKEIPIADLTNELPKITVENVD